MRTKLTVASLLMCGLAAMAITAWLPAQPPEAERPARGGGFLRGLPLMAALDADQDGRISAAEMENAAAALKSLDKDNDGVLSEAELRPTFSGGAPGTGGRGFGQAVTAEEMIGRYMALDANGDGKLSKEELGEQRAAFLSRADADQDGFLTRDEIGAVFREPPAGFGRGFDPQQTLERLMESDADKDGKLSKEELGERYAFLLRVDPNQDGFLTREELSTYMQQWNRFRGGSRGFTPPDPQAFVERALQFDANGDGMLDKEELARMGQQGGFSGRGSAGFRRPPGEGEARPQRPSTED